MMKWITVMILSGCVTLVGQNPIVPPGVYFADPAAQVWEDGRLYLYGSVDESTDYYCSWRYHVLSTGDLKEWTIHENSFASRGEGDAVPYNDKLLFAPDCMYRDGKYYLYYCQPDLEQAEGVAVSDRPYGPFREARLMNVGRYSEIDPGVFIDDDGTGYYLWGQFTLKMARLEKGMTAIDTSTIADRVLSEDEHFFHEGAYMTKHNGLYYLVYADMSRGNMPACIGYATSEQPMGPYTYRGVIIDNDHSDPECWNNHGSIAEFNGQWYVFYHRATHNSRMMRKACVEPIEILADGSIPEVEMTSQGTGPPLKATSEIDAARACWMFGDVRIELIEPGNEGLTHFGDRDRAVFRYIDFPEGVRKVTMRIKPGKEGCSLHLKLKNPWGPTVAMLNVPANDEADSKVNVPANGKSDRKEVGKSEASSDGQSDDWVSLTADAEIPPGTHALWLVCYGGGKGEGAGCSVDHFRFH